MPPDRDAHFPRAGIGRAAGAASQIVFPVAICTGILGQGQRRRLSGGFARDTPILARESAGIHDLCASQLQN